ncbi:MAG: hypothetical protein ACRBDL_08190 [Alphaproteobacteria bacterium]
MSNFKAIKKQLSMSTTLPAGSGGEASPWMMGSAHQPSHTHHHAEDGSCCGHEHHDHDHAHHHDDDECEEDHTNPSGGCGCC